MGRLHLATAALMAAALVTVAASSDQSHTHVFQPASGEPGDTITSSGENWQGAQIEIFLDTVSGIALATAPINASAFKVDWILPNGTSVGSHNVIACADRNQRDDTYRSMPRECSRRATGAATRFGA